MKKVVFTLFMCVFALPLWANQTDYCLLLNDADDKGYNYKRTSRKTKRHLRKVRRQATLTGCYWHG